MGKVAFKQCDVERLLRAARAVGYAHPTVDKLPDGTLRLLTDEGIAPANSPTPDELDAELEAYRASRGRG